MRKIKNLILIITFVLLMGIGFNVKAESFEYYLTNSNNYEPINNSEVKTIQKGDTITVTAMLNNSDDVTNYKISSGKLTIRWDDKYLSLQEVDGKYYNDSISDISGLTLSSVNKSSNKLTIGSISSTGVLKNRLNKIVNFKFKVLDDAVAGETKIYQMDGEDSLKCINSEEKVISCGESSLSELKYNISKSTVNKLSSIKINGMELEHFSEDNFTYDITVDSDVDKVNISVTKQDNNSKISGNYGETKLSYGKNKLAINVFSESGSRNTYTLNITREDERSGINTLKTLTLSSGTINFKPTVTEYNVNVENSVDKITITSSLTDSKSRYVEDFSRKEIELVEGSNKIQIKVLSEKNEEKVYTININRALNTNNKLKSLKVNDEVIKLTDDEFTYNIILENEVEEVVIKAVASDPKATVDLKDKYPLEVGENEIKFNVIAASGDKAAYTINITRNKILSKDALLKTLSIKGYKIDFKQDVKLYYLKINDKDQELEITAEAEDENAKVEIEGNKDLENGSIIKINVKAEDGTYTGYFINIEKGSKGISVVVIIIIILLLLLGACLAILYIRKKKQEKKEFSKLDEVGDVPSQEEVSNNPLENSEEKEKNEEDTQSELEDTFERDIPNIKEENSPSISLEKGAHEYTGEHEYNENAERKDIE